MKRFYAAITAGVFLLSSVPYLYAYLRQSMQGTHLRFTGIVFDVVDTAQYFAWMRSFSHTVLIANPLTPDPGANRFFNLQWWLLGLLAYHTPLGIEATYQLLRVVALVGFAVALAAFCRRVAPEHRLFAFGMVMLSSGLGWLLLFPKYGLDRFWYPLDSQIAEANTFFSAMAFPHLLVAGGVTLAIFTLFLDAAGWKAQAGSGGPARSVEAAGGDLWPSRPVLARCVVIAALTFALGLSHGYDLIPVVVIPLGMIGVLLLRRRSVRGVAPAGWAALGILAGGGPAAIYVLALTRLDPTWKGVLAQYGNAGVFTPTPPHLIILLGLPFLLALWQLRPACWQGEDLGPLFVRIWLVLGLALLYIPTNYQIKMLTAYQVPVGILAAETVAAFWRRRSAWMRSQRWPRVAVVGALLLLVVGTNLYLVAWRVLDLHRATYPYYLTSGDVRALQALDGVAKPGQVVLSSPDLGEFVPVYSDARPFVAHWAQTLDYYARRDEATRFYAPGTSETDRQAIIDRERIAFVLAGPAEQALGGQAGLVRLPLPQVVAGSTIVYRTSATIGQR